MAFDTRVHHRNSKTGQIIRTTPYTLEVVNGVKHFIRDGVKYYENGSLVDAVDESVVVESKSKIDEKVDSLLQPVETKPVSKK